MSKKEQESQFVEKLINIRRVTKVVKGGKNLRFSALVVVGDGKGRVSYATQKAREVPDAIKKASNKARKTLKKVPLRFGKSLHHDFTYRNNASRVCIRSAKSGTGVIAGGGMRSVFEALGVHDVVAKSMGTSNAHNVVRTTIKALTQTESPRQVATRRGLTIAEINHRRKVLLTKSWTESDGSNTTEGDDND